MKKLIHQFVLALLSLGFIWGSLGWFTDVRGFGVDDQQDVLVFTDTGVKADFQAHDAQASREIASTEDMHEGDRVSSRDTSGVRLTFPGGGEVRLAAKTTVELFAPSPGDDRYHLLLTAGEAWVTTQGAFHPISVYALGGVVVNSDDNAFDISLKNGVVDVLGARNSVRVSLFLPLRKPSSTPALLNSVLVTEGNHVSVALSKIQPKLEKLLYSKLVKEFQYGPVSADSLSRNTWFQSQSSKDKDRRESMLKRTVDAIKERGLTVSDPGSVFTSVMESLHNVRSLMTFDSGRQNLRSVDELFVHLDDAIFYYATSQQERGNVRMELFRARLQEMSGNAELLTLVSDGLWDRFHSYGIFIPQDGSLFKIRSELRGTLLTLNNSGHKISYVRASELARSYLFDIYQSLNFDSSETRDLLTAYFTSFHKIFASYSGDITKHPNVLAEENQLLTQLYLKDPVFYQEIYFQNKFDLEAQWLSLLPEGRDKDEESQTLVASKIELMKRLRLFFFAEKVSVSDASSVLFRLLSDISNAVYQTDTAVAQYFKESLDAQEDFWQYLNSSDFAESKIYGSTHKERFTAFLKNKKDVAEITTLQEGLLGTIPLNAPDSKATFDDIQKTFAAVGVKSLKISPLLDKDQSQIFIESAEYNSIPFSGIYDRDRNLISDVKVYNETILTASIPLDKLKSIFQIKPQQDSAFSAAPVVSISGETRVEKVAKLFLLKKLQELTFSLDVSQIQTLNYDKKLFVVRGARLPLDKSQILVDFTVDLIRNEVSTIKVTLLKSQQTMIGVHPYASVADAIKKYYNQEFYKAISTDSSTTTSVVSGK